MCLQDFKWLQKCHTAPLMTWSNMGPVCEIWLVIGGIEKLHMHR